MTAHRFSTGKTLRLGLSGSAGTGKTTLAEALGGALGLPVVEEGMRRRLEAGLDLHDLDADGHRALLLALYDEMIAGLDAAAARGDGGVVTDRSPLDFMAFWLYYSMGWDEAATDAAMVRFAEGLARYDAILLLPWGAIPLVEDGVRSGNRWHQYHFQMVLEGIVANAPAAPPVLRLPAEARSPEDRMRWVREALGEVGAAARLSA